MKIRNKQSGIKRGVQILICMLLVTLLTSCGIIPEFDVEGETASEMENYIVIGYSQLGSESQWRTTNTMSMQEALSKENGFYLITSNGRQKQENQIKAVRRFISQQVDYIVLSPVTETGWDTVLQEAKEAGIPVILADRMISVEDPSLYTTWIGTDSYEEGVSAGNWLARDLRLRRKQSEDINIVVLSGTEGASAQVGRSSGFNEIASYHSNWHILEETSGDFTSAKGKEIMKQMLRTYDDIDVVVAQNDDMMFGAIEALKEEGISTGIDGEVTVISFDATKDALKMVQDGTINVDVECNPLQGPYVAEVIQRLEKGEPVAASYAVDEQVFTIDNVGQYIDERIY